MMARSTTTARTRLLLLACTGILLLAGIARAEPKCFDSWGNEDPNQLPCFAAGTADSGGTTWCCNKNDHCLSNGLCLSPSANNLMTQQGCTDRSWGQPCEKLCAASDDEKSRSLNEIPLVPCPASLDRATNDVKFCCGGSNTTACCADRSAWIAIPAGAIVRSASTSASTSGGDGNAYSLKIGLGIGLGIGVPILLVLLAVAYLLAQPLRRRHNRRKRRHQQQQQQQQHSKNRYRGGLTAAGGGGGAARGQAGGADGTTEKSSSSSATSDSRSRRDSFGRVDTHVGPPSDDEDGGHAPAHWPPPPTGLALARAWAARAGGAVSRYPFALIGSSGHGGAAAAAGADVGVGRENPLRLPPLPPLPLPRPPSPKEMDGRSRSRLRGRASTPAELPTDGTELGRRGGGGGVGGLVVVEGREKGRGKVRVAAEEVELPTPEGDVEAGLAGRAAAKRQTGSGR